MPTELTIKVHEIATDGLPDMDKLAGKVAFIFDGCIVSWWPLVPEQMRAEGLTIHRDITEWAARGQVLWEGDSDVSDSRMKANVTHWIEFPVPVWEIA
jgi:hypothetical protein